MKKEILVKVMKRAWEIKKEDSKNVFGLCLKMAWAEVKEQPQIVEAIIAKAEAIADKASLWTKAGKTRLYVDYKNRNFYIDLTDTKNIVARYNAWTKGNICNVRDFLEDAGIKFEPFRDTSIDAIKIM